MGKLQLMILVFIIISLCLHTKSMIKDRDHFKKLFPGKTEDKKRILYLDYIRLIATLFVILVHCLDSSSSGLTTKNGTWIAVQSLISVLFVCNTLFIMNSGALILNRNEGALGSFYYKRFIQVAIPFFCYYGIYILLSSQYFTSGFLNGLLKAWKDMIAGPIDWAPHLWVIYVILSLYILAPFFSILLKHLPDSMLHGLAALILIFRCIAVYLPVFGLPVNFQLMISPWEGVFLLGYYFAHPASLSHKRLFLGLGGVSLIGTVLCVAYRPDYKAILLAEGAPMMILLAGSIFLLFRSMESRLPAPGRIMKFLIRYSYSILLVHWAVLYFVRERFEITQNAVLSFGLVLLFSAVAAFLFDQTVIYCVQSFFQGLARLGRKK
jgi:peptidoglycan/LPS O-acetylase OafA/YrhL